MDDEQMNTDSVAEIFFETLLKETFGALQAPKGERTAKKPG